MVGRGRGELRLGLNIGPRLSESPLTYSRFVMRLRPVDHGGVGFPEIAVFCRSHTRNWKADVNTEGVLGVEGCVA
ncbi:hypothetical protein J6590_022535 [Homalodisca vitripennis]|nr:hypothetical protein J6590_022535 [Homalodisca vitripennis]